MNETHLADRVCELEARVNALEAINAARDEVPPIPTPPWLFREVTWLIVVLLQVPAQQFGWSRVERWAARLGVGIMTSGVRVAAWFGTPAQRAHAARVYGRDHV